ncbi:NAD-dependent epimerase/dehydratase family protein [Mycetohabitans sp. B8]|nr:NAD-dependent epimerase/dehydratase family protein [Mycetohabitans sp. B8]MCG1043560.1 NAD-dependent epimerase/dehydratase family protein [Mycetohabitans sp. B8]
MQSTSVVVVLGVSGFIGRYIVNALVDAGKRVVVATRWPFGPHRALAAHAG